MDHIDVTTTFAARRRAQLGGVLGPEAEALFPATYSDPAPSPDGSRIAWISDRDGRPRAWVGELSATPVDEPDWPLPTGLDPATPADVQAISWSPDGTWLACQLAPGGSGHTRVVLVSPDGSGHHEIAPGAAAVTLGSWSPAGRHLGVTIYSPDHGDGQACLIDLRDGTSTLLTSGPAPRVCAVSGDGHRVVVRVGGRGTRRLELIDLRTGGRTDLLPGSDAGVADAYLDLTGSRLFLHTDTGREHAALLSVSLSDGVPGMAQPLAARAHDDLDLVAFDPAGGHAAVVWNVDGRSELELLDLRSGLTGPLPEPSGDVVTAVAFTGDGRTLLLASEGPATPPQLERIDLHPGVPAMQAFPVLPAEPPENVQEALDGLVAPTLHEFRAEDGLTLSGWLFRPRGAMGATPALIWLPGRAGARQRPSFRSLFQALVAEGITVFAPTLRDVGRGSSRTDRLAVVTDIRAAAAFLTGSGLADSARIGVAGHGDGGHLTLAALAGFPELFRVGVEMSGIADFASFYASTEPWVVASVAPAYGDPETDRELLHELSPIHRIDRIVAPLLVVHGRQDTRVPLDAAEQVVAALREHGASPGFLLFDDEGHEVRGSANRAALVREVVRWVSDNVCGIGSRTA
ncbi:S9 family peptidase [Pseudonocardia asaccharolytica]|uniref:Peptidase S9 n=1 Tax=Pseudonocardia asaccharolytica DSM 44247 = NBRC 16224 TaxID=1123024 RepID=A0A511D770_9PSEU|nr:prolyl oligopeptidase family serine peptidase [Pseudonocardia asaccharolytica]GEL20640.1 peptidase S9 [Pseudonocardia asaccharolytica DSM 44247 = NBRC 16224]